MEADEDGYYIRGDYVGKLGVEKSYEKYLRGEKGIEILLRDDMAVFRDTIWMGPTTVPLFPART